MAVQNMADIRGPDHRLDSRLHRTLFLAADEGVLHQRRAISARRRGAGSDAGNARSLSGRAKRRRQRQRRMEGGQSFAAPGRHAGRTSCTEHHRGLFPDLLSRPGRICRAGKRRARDRRAPGRHDHPVVRQWPDGSRAQGPQRAGGEPAQQCPACERMRRPRPLLHLPHSRDRRLQFAAGAVAARGVRTQPGRSGRPLDPARLPAQARDRSVLLPALHAAGDVGERERLAAAPHRPGALSGQHVRGHARLDQTCREPVAVRYRLHRQPLPGRGVAGRDRMRRSTQPVRRRRAIGAVRAQHRARRPPAARRCERRP